MGSAPEVKCGRCVTGGMGVVRAPDRVPPAVLTQLAWARERGGPCPSCGCGLGGDRVQETSGQRSSVFILVSGAPDDGDMDGRTELVWWTR